MSEADEEPMEKPGDEWGMKTTEPGERGEMSKKYSTGELVKIIKNGMLFVEGSKAIIARLRSADKLCKMAKEAKESQGWDGNNPDDDRWIILYAKLRQAIAEYERSSDE